MTRLTVTPRLYWNPWNLEEGDGAFGLFVLGEGDAGMIVNADVDKLPTDALAIALTSAIAGDAVAEFVETAELLDVDADHLARSFALIAANRLGRLQVAYPTAQIRLTVAGDTLTSSAV